MKIDSDSDEENSKKEDGESSLSKDSTPSPKMESDSQSSFDNKDVKEESQSSTGYVISLEIIFLFSCIKTY